MFANVCSEAVEDEEKISVDIPPQFRDNEIVLLGKKILASDSQME